MMLLFCLTFWLFFHKTIDVVEVVADKSTVGKVFKQDAKLITGYLEKLTNEEIEALENQIKQESG